MKIIQNKSRPILRSFGVNLEKGKKMPIGTISRGRKKVAEGKWVDVKESGIVNKKEKNKSKLNKDLQKLEKKAKFSSQNYKKRFSGKEKNILTIDLYKLENIKDTIKSATELGFSTNQTEVEYSFGRGQIGAETREALIIWKNLNKKN